MKLIVGLGNPGREYERTRHNVGFEVVDELARRCGVALRRSWRFAARMAEASVGGERALLVHPLTFMNRSGDVVSAIARRKGIATGELVVIVDDADLDRGKLRIRPKGSAGGHNGLKSVAERLGSEEFARVRVGIGRGLEGTDMVGYVLGKFTPSERAEMTPAIARAADAVECVVTDGLEPAMNRYNG